MWAGACCTAQAMGSHSSVHMFPLSHGRNDGWQQQSQALALNPIKTNQRAGPPKHNTVQGTSNVIVWERALQQAPCPRMHPCPLPCSVFWVFQVLCCKVVLRLQREKGLDRGWGRISC